MSNIKEQIIEMARQEGWDMFRACEIAYGFLSEMKRRQPGKYKYYIGKVGFVVVKRATRQQEV